MRTIEGVFSALVTPLDDERLNERVLRKLVEFHLGNGLAGFFLCGSTGQGILLSVAERRRVAEVVVEQNRGRGIVIVHAGAPSTRDVADLARHAEQLGADAVASLPPFYFKVDRAAIIEHYRTIAQATSLPLLMYHIPNLTQVRVTTDLVRELLGVGNFVGMKYTDYDLYHMQNLIKASPRPLIILSGAEEMFFPALTMGAQGSIGTAQNCLPWAFAEIFRAYRAGDYGRGRRLQELANNVIALLDSCPPGLATTHDALALLGFPCGSLRQPLRDLTEREREEFRSLLDRSGFFALQSEAALEASGLAAGMASQ